MKIKDIKGSLDSIKIKIPDNIFKDNLYGGPKKQEVYLTSFWNKGLWVKEDLESTKIFPICIDNVQETLEWEVIE